MKSSPNFFYNHIPCFLCLLLFHDMNYFPLKCSCLCLHQFVDLYEKDFSALWLCLGTLNTRFQSSLKNIMPLLQLPLPLQLPLGLQTASLSKYIQQGATAASMLGMWGPTSQRKAVASKWSSVLKLVLRLSLAWNTLHLISAERFDVKLLKIYY